MDGDRDGDRSGWGEYRDGEADGNVIESREKEEDEEKEAEEQNAGSDHMHLGFYLCLDFPREKI